MLIDAVDSINPKNVRIRPAATGRATIDYPIIAIGRFFLLFYLESAFDVLDFRAAKAIE